MFFHISIKPLELFILFIAMISVSCFAQEDCYDGIDNDGDLLIDLNDPDCDCGGLKSITAVEGIFPNPSFEDYSCCPVGYSQMSCVDEWQQGSAWATSDYWNLCGFSTYTDFCPAETPLPDGNGWVGFINGWTGSSTYKEYVGMCLNSPLIAGTSYDLNLWIAMGAGNTSIDLTIFGTPNCADLGWAPMTCPVGSGSWEELGNTTASFTTCGEWTNVTITFTPAVDINAIVLGGPCAASLPPSGEIYNYYYLDGFQLAENIESGEITEAGLWCTEDLSLTSSIDATGWTAQWYLNGIALPGETTEVLNVMPYGAGTYTMVYSLDGSCDTTSYSLVVPDYPEANFSWANQCFNEGEMNLQDSSIASSGTIVSWEWDFGDGGGSSTETDPTYPFSSPGTYDVSLTVTTDLGCSDTISYPVTIYPEPVATFDYSLNGVYS